MMYPAKKVYKGDAAATYERRRTAGVMARVEWNHEFRLVKDLLTWRVAPGETVLDAPTGTGRFIPLLRQLGLHATGIDISRDMLRFAYRYADRGSANLVLGDCEFLPFGDDAFDYVLSMRYMGHLPPEARTRVLRELKRVSRKGMIVGFPILNSFTAFKFKLGNIQYKLRKGEKRPWWPATARSLAVELAEAGVRISEMHRLLGPFSQIAILYLTRIANP